MASSLRLITSNLVKRSLLPTLVSSSRFHSIIAGHRSYSTMPKDDLCDYSWVNVKCPKISSLSFKMEMSDRKRKISLAIPDEGLSVELDDFPALNIQETKACSEQTLFVQGKPHKDISLNVLNKTSSSDDTTPNKDGVILNIIANEIIASFRDMTTKRGWAYYDMFFDRSILGKGLCPIIAAMSSINSFTLLKEKTHRGGLEIKMSLPGRDTLKVTTQGLRVSLKMHGLGRNDVKLSYDYDTFFIEGKTKQKHYITGIKLPEGFQKKNNRIRREMKHGEFFAFLPCDVKKTELLLADHLKPQAYITASDRFLD